MRRRYRSQAGIVHDILDALHREGPLPATRIAMQANLPYDRLKAMLSQLEADGLVARTEHGYKITPKGLQVLNTLKRCRSLLESLGFRL